jgi:hypothetical protein
MATDTLVALYIALAFGVFAVTLYWADTQTRGVSG